MCGGCTGPLHIHVQGVDLSQKWSISCIATHVGHDHAYQNRLLFHCCKVKVAAVLAHLPIELASTFSQLWCEVCETMLLIPSSLACLFTPCLHWNLLGISCLCVGRHVYHTAYQAVESEPLPVVFLNL